jgi:flagellar basal body P-ring formation protein FlgA
MRLAMTLLLMPGLAVAESLVALRTIPAKSIVTADDLTVVEASIPGAISESRHVVGQEAKVTVFAGQPILYDSFAAPALVERNQVVVLIFAAGSLRISVEGRALNRASEGEMVRVMNLSSRTMVQGIVGADGTIKVGQN